MMTGHGTSERVPAARRFARTAARLVSVVGMLAALAACTADSYHVPWQVSAPSQRVLGAPPPIVVVQRGDTVFGISRHYGVPMRDIIDANRLSPPYVLYVGQRLTMPRPAVHVVQRGDTLSGIARAHGVDMNAMARINRLGPPYLIQVGEHLLIPDAQQTRPSAVTAVAAASPRPSSPASSATLAPIPTAKPAPPPSRQVAQAFRPAPTPVSAPAPPAPPARASGTFAWPVAGTVVSGYGPKGNGTRNDGVNIAAPRGTPVRSAENGVVVYAGNELRGFGNLLLVKHADGWMTAYGHNELLLVKKGDTVRRGDVIARVGNTGNVSTPQLHFEIRRGSRAVDPMPLLGRQMATRN